MHINEMQMKIIAIGLVPVFLILTFALPKTASTAILLGIVMITGFVVCFIGMSMQRKEARENEDLLEIPPKKRTEISFLHLKTGVHIWEVKRMR